MTTEVSQSVIIAVIAGMAVVNFSIRFLPIAVLSRFDLPKPVLRWLSYVPVSVMGALVASQVLRPNDTWVAPLGNPGFFAAILTAVVFRFTRSFLGATAAGVIAFVALRAFL